MSSLQLLQASFASPSPPTPEEPTLSQVEALTCQLAEHLSYRDWDNPALLALLSPDIAAHFDQNNDYSNPTARNREQFIARFQALCARHPEYRTDVISATAEGETTGRAKVWLVVKVWGRPRNTCRESVLVIHWRWERERWVAFWVEGVWGVAAEG